MATKLTQRERDVLALIATGKTNRQISEQLILALSTVKWYIRQIYTKLGATDRKEAIDFALEHNLVEYSEIRKSNLPLAATPFVGRERELTALDQLISDSHSRVITILGAGGIGKTRLAIEAARSQSRKSTLTEGKIFEPAFPDGIIFVSMTSVGKTEDIIPSLGDALQVPIDFSEGVPRSARQQLLDYFDGKTVLLVIDNFEHLLEGVDLLGDIVNVASGSCLLITSRERLLLSGEQVFPIQGLQVPDPISTDEKDFQDYAAVELFLNTARRVFPDFSVSEDEVANISRICHLVEGMPLGIELAASWVSVLPLEEIVREIEQNLGFLATELRDVPDRHRSMQAALGASWKRLRDQQRVAFQNLSVFCGGFTRLAALDVANASLPLLVTLTNKSWLSYDRRTDRYHIHELLRQYGALKLSVDPIREEAALDRHSAFFCHYLGEREAGWRGPRQKEIASEVQHERKNIKTAWEWALKQQKYDCLGDGLDSLCLCYGWEGRSSDALAVCRTLSNQLSQLSISSPEILCLQARALAWESEFKADHTSLEPLLDRSMGLLDAAALEGRDVSTERAFLQLQRSLSAFHRDYEISRQLYEEALKQYREIGILWGEAEALSGLGGCYLFLGRHDRAAELFRKSLVIQKKIGNSLGAAEVLGELGLVAKHQGRLMEAEDYHSESLRLFRALGHQLREINMAGTLAYTLDWSGKFEHAEQIARSGLAAAHDLAYFFHVFPLGALAMACMHRGSYIEARKYALDGFESASSNGLKQDAGWHQLYTGMLAVVEGEHDVARDALTNSTAILKKTKHILTALPRAMLVYPARAKKDTDQANSHLDFALRSGLENRSFFLIVNCLPLAALQFADRGDIERAAELYELAWSYDYVANSQWFSDVVGQELAQIITSLPSDIASGVRERGRALDLWETADQIISELTG